MISVWQLTLLTLATWRISSMLVNEEGPWSIFRKLREKVGISEDGPIVTVPDGMLPGVLSCVWCCSVWVAAFWLVLWVLIPTIATYLAAWLSISTLSIVVDGINKRMR